MICMDKFVDKTARVYIAYMKHYIHNQFDNIHKFTHL